jgi:hypothetical protein
MPEPAVVTIAVQETPPPVDADDVKLAAAPNALQESASPRVEPPPAIVSTTSPVGKPARKRAVTARYRARFAPYPSWFYPTRATGARVAHYPSWDTSARVAQNRNWATGFFASNAVGAPSVRRTPTYR